MPEHAPLRWCVLAAALLAGRAVELHRATLAGTSGDASGEGPAPRLGSGALGGALKKNKFTKIELSSVLYPKAKCLDGSQGVYYLSHGSGNGAHKYYIHRQGGGYCFNEISCHMRSKTRLGSSLEKHGWRPEMDMMDKKEGFEDMGFSRDPAENPLMHNWNHVFVIYCDGGYFAGARAEPYEVQETVNSTARLYMGGSHIMHGVLHSLAYWHGMRGATDIVVGGCSAGGISTIITANWLRDQILSVMPYPVFHPTPKIAGLVCSGFFLDYDYGRGGGEGQVSVEYRNQKYQPYHFFDVHAQVNQGCVKEYGGHDGEEVHRCLVAQTSAHFAEIPLFLWESLYDDYMLSNVLEEKNCQEAACAEPHSKNIRTALYTLWHLKPDFGGFLSGCGHHCMSSRGGSVQNTRPIDGKKPMQAFDQWYRTIAKPVEKGTPAANKTQLQRYWTEEAPYPCPACCPQTKAAFHRVDDNLE